MFFIIFVKPREKSLGTFGEYEVMEVGETLYLFFIPVFTWNRQYYAKDAEGNAFLLSEETGKALRRGEKDRITAFDLGEQMNARGGFDSSTEGILKKCPYCGFTTTENYTYCPKCAEKLEGLE